MNRRARWDFCALKTVFLAVFLFMGGFEIVSGQETAEPVAVTAGFDAGKPVPPDAFIYLEFNRLPGPKEGHIGILIGESDVTAFFAVTGKRYIYNPANLPLPVGKSDVTVYLISDREEWKEIGRFPLNIASPGEQTADNEAGVVENNETAPVESTPAVDSGEKKTESAPPEESTAAKTDPPAVETTPKPRRFGFDEITFTPSLTLTMKSQPAQFNDPGSTRPAQRATFTDGTLQSTVKIAVVRGGFKASAQADFAGSTNQEEALRFSTLGNRAPKVDLSSFLLEFEVGKAKWQLGHFSFGGFRHLVNGFSSRGITVAVPFAGRFDFSAAAMNGTSVVGFGNFFGLDNGRHQLQSMTLGVEVFEKKPGALRLEFGGMHGYVSALNGVSDASVNDVERSQGGSVKLLFADPTGRVKGEAGFSRSRFDNPADPLLEQGDAVAAGQRTTRNARYIEIAVEAIRNRVIFKEKTLALTVNYKHERVDPLYKSLGASTQADKTSQEVSANATIGDLAIQSGYNQFNDNLADVPSILKSVTRAYRVNVSFPAAMLFRGKIAKSPLLPRVSYGFDRTHQFGEAIPVGGGFEFAPEAIPDQFQTNQTLGLEWTLGKFSFGYNYNRALTDNEQLTRETADQLNQVHAVKFGFNSGARFQTSVELNRESAFEREFNKTSRTWRVGTSMTWQIDKRFTWTGNLTHTIAGDIENIARNRNVEFDTQLAFTFGVEKSKFRKVQTQAFIRFADRLAITRDFAAGTRDRTRVQIINAGITITFF
jgi:hypothetical protein